MLVSYSPDTSSQGLSFVHLPVLLAFKHTLGRSGRLGLAQVGWRSFELDGASLIISSHSVEQIDYGRGVTITRGARLFRALHEMIPGKTLWGVGGMMSICSSSIKIMPSSFGSKHAEFTGGGKEGRPTSRATPMQTTPSFERWPLPDLRSQSETITGENIKLIFQNCMRYVY